MKTRQKKSRKGDKWVTAAACLSFIATFAGTMFITSSLAAHPIAPPDVVSEAVVKEIEEISKAEPMPIITEELISEVIAGERPYVAESIRDEPQPRYPLSDEERDEVERVMMAECGGEERDGMIAVGQCILNACEESGLRPHEALKKYGYTHIRKEPSEAVQEAVCAVFDRGEVITDEPILYFYADYAKSPWHESQHFVMQIGVHRFFGKRGQGK